jgi:N-acetylneuraminic acid mutarotase
MKIKTFILIVCAIALFFTGCEKDEFFTETTDNAVLKSAVKELPVKLIGSGYATVTDFAYVEALGDYFPSEGLSGGTITHLGKTQADKSVWHTVSVVPDPDNFGILLWKQEGDWCAANGDMLHWIIDGTVDMINKKVGGRAIFDGGTGRFATATGYFDLNGHVDPDNPAQFIVDSGVGMISNVGSGKSKDNAWTYKTPMSIGRGFTSGAIADNKIYITGGFPTHFSVTPTMEMYNPLNDTWTPKADMPEGRCAHATCAYQGKIYVFGGVSPHPYASATKNVFVYNPKTDTWTQKADMPYSNAFCGIAVINDFIYLVGGMQNYASAPVSTLMAYNPSTDTWTEKSPMPTARGMLSACAVKGKLYAIGGTLNFLSSSFDLVEVYDPLMDTWTTKSNMPTARVSISTCTMMDKIFAIGGYAFPTMYNTNEMYNPGADKWVTKAPMQETRQTFFLGSVGNKIYAVGGSYPNPENPAEPVILSSIEEYDFSKD